MDYLSSLPDAILSIIHHLVHKLGGLRSVLHFEAASKKLSISFREYSRLKLAISVKHPALPRYVTRSTTAGLSFPFSKWLAAHGHRMDGLTLDELQLQPGQPALCGQPGLTQVSELTITTSAPQTLEPLQGLGNLVQLKCRDVGGPAGQYGAGVRVSLEPLGLLTALKSLDLVDKNCFVDSCGNHELIDVCRAISSLAPLSSLTNLTELGLFGLDAPPISLAALSSLSPTLSRLSCLVGDVSMDHVSSFTNLTSLSWAADEIVNLEPIGKLLKLRSLHVKAVYARLYVDLQPLCSLEMLLALRLDGYIHPISMQPIGGLGSTLQELIMSDARMIQTIQVTFSELTALTRLEVTCGSLLDFLSPLTHLKQLKVCCEDCASLEPIQVLTALTQLALDAAYEVTSLVPLSPLGCLQHLRLVSFDSLSSLQPLSTLTALKSVELWLCESVSSLAPLSTLTALTSLDLRQCGSVSSLEPLAAVVGLRQLTIDYCVGVDKSMCSLLLSALPGLTLGVKNQE